MDLLTRSLDCSATVTLAGSAAWTLTTTSWGFGGGLLACMPAQLVINIPTANNTKILLVMAHFSFKHFFL
jgi:hypothetical protein